MKTKFDYLKYLFILPIFILQFSCDETTVDAILTDATVTDTVVHNGNVVGSWMLTDLTGIYTYVIDLPGPESGVTWPADTSFGVKLRWESASLLSGYETSTDQWLNEFKVDSVALYQPAEYNLATMQALGFGLIGVFEDAPSAGADATYKMKGQYPGIFYNYSVCKSEGSTAPMTDQGLYTWDTTATNNFVIKRDPSIGGSQVLPPFSDGNLTLVNDTTLNIQFVDRDSHSELYAQVMDYWEEGKHPNTAYGGNGQNSGGDRTYMAFPDSLAINEAGVFVGLYDGTAGTTKSNKGYVYNEMLAPWGGFYTWYAYVYGGESAAIKGTPALIQLADADSDGTVSDAEVVTYMLSNPDNPTFGGLMPGSPKYGDLVVVDSATGYKFVDDSATDFTMGGTDTDGGKMKFMVVSDCAAPVDVTIQFDATFKRCTTDNCAGDGYHVAPTW